MNEAPINKTFRLRHEYFDHTATPSATLHGSLVCMRTNVAPSRFPYGILVRALTSFGQTPLEINACRHGSGTDLAEPARKSHGSGMICIP